MYRTRAKTSLLVLFGLALALPLCSETLDGVRDVPTTTSNKEANVAYRAWISENEESDLYPRAAIELAALLDDLNERRTVLTNALEVAELPEDRHDALRALAVVSEGLGDLVEAQRLFREASFALPDEKDFESLLDSALISFELGQYRNAEAQSRVIMETVRDLRLRMGATVLLSRIYYAVDRENDAIDLLVEFTKTQKTELDAPGLYWQYRLATMMGRSGIADESIGQLESRYSDSLEAALARGELIRLPTPSALLEATAFSTDTNNPIDPEQTPDSDPISGVGRPNRNGTNPNGIFHRQGERRVRRRRSSGRRVCGSYRGACSFRNALLSCSCPGNR